MPVYDFSGKVALVTGAGGGIGRATALAFARAGARVLIADMNEAGGAETAAMIAAEGGESLFQPCDVANAADVEAMMRRVAADWGRLDFAHNNAGVNNPVADEWEDEVWRRALGINLTGVMLCMRAEAEMMLAQGGGAIVNTASINGLVGNGAQPAYVASKHGVVGLTRHGALRWARAGIRVNCVCPGVIETPMTEAVASDPRIRKLMEDMTPMGRMGRPEEIAGAVLWLCSDAASFVTGHPLVIDGGATAI